MSKQGHWQSMYETMAEDEVSWFQERPVVSLGLIEEMGLPRSARIVDVGGGASRLVDYLIEAGYTNLNVLDLADAALAKARARLGRRAADVEWIVADATHYAPESTWDLWHDRAVFHFLVEANERELYREALLGALAPGGHVIIATFGPEGPMRCSGLPTMSYGPDELRAVLGPELTLRKSVIEDHRTPSGSTQQFSYCWLTHTGR